MISWVVVAELLGLCMRSGGDKREPAVYQPSGGGQAGKAQDIAGR